jgi:hypothetical protein
MSSLNEYTTRIRANAIAKGFWEKERNFGEMIALIHSEASEALEAHRTGGQPYETIDGKPEGWVIELIDTIIRCLDTIGPNTNIDELMELKLKYNESRVYKHGKAY